MRGLNEGMMKMDQIIGDPSGQNTPMLTAVPEAKGGLCVPPIVPRFISFPIGG